MVPWDNHADMLHHIRDNYSRPDALNYFENGAWHTMSHEMVLQEIKYIALGLHRIRLQRGQRIGLMSLPSPRWTIVSFGIIISGCVMVPLFPNISEENFIFEVIQTELNFLFVEHPESIPNFMLHKDRFSTVIDMTVGVQNKSGMTYEKLLEVGREYDKEFPNLYNELEQDNNPEETAAIIYTSGSTGLPKGVELTNRNIIRHLYDQPFDVVNKETVYLSILPLAHIFGLTMNLIVFGWGGSIYYYNDIRNFGEMCRQIHPTLLVVVPRLLEKVYIKILAKIQQAGFLQRRIGQWAFNLANNEEEQGFFQHLLFLVADKVVYSHFRDALGGRINVVISGGAPLNPHLNHFYQSIGIPIYEGWGMTEVCPVTVNYPENNKIGYVGKPFKNLEVKISPEGELLVRGSAVMRGYYLNPEATAKTIDSEGWLHSGDKAQINEEGYVKILGRLKELFKTSTGEYVAPVPIEQEICTAPLIEMAMVVAEGRKYVSVLLFPNKEVLDHLKEDHQVDGMNDADFLNGKFVQDEMEKLLVKINRHLNHWEQVRAWRFIPHRPSIEEGEMTPSMKIRREVVMNKYKQEIDLMYPEEPKI